MKEEIYNINNLWGYTYRMVNMQIFTISFEKKEGFRSKEEAIKNQKIDQKQYEKDIKKIKTMTNIKYTFTEFLEYWFDNIYVTREKTSTKIVASFAIEFLIIPNVKNDILFSYITAEYLNTIIKKCIEISPASGHICKKILRHVLTDAKLYGYISKDLKQELMTVPEVQNNLELLNHEEIKKLLNTAKNYPAYYFEFLLALFAGLRQGEILALKYSNFNKEEQTLTIDAQYTKSYNLSKDKNGNTKIQSSMSTKPPKSGSARVLKIPAFLFDELDKKQKYNAQLLKKAKEKGIKPLPVNYVSLSVLGPRKTSSSLTPALKKICKKAGVPLTRMHALRHMFASLMIEEGVPLEQISKCMGHKSVLTTFNTYVNIIDADNQAREFLKTICPSASIPDKKGCAANV